MKQSDLNNIITEEVEGMLNMLGTAMAEGKGQDLADKYVAKLRSEFRKLNDDELDEFKKTIVQSLDLNESVNEADKYVDARGNFKLRNGLEVKIKPASEIKKFNVSKDYMKYNLQIAGKTVKIEKAFRGVFGGAPSEFTVKGYEAFETRSTGKPRVGFTQSIIGDVVRESVNEGSRRDPESIRKEYEELKKHSMMALVSAWSRINKVGNPKSLDKEGLISDLLRAKHGNKYVDKAFESVNEFFSGKVDQIAQKKFKKDFNKLSNSEKKWVSDQVRNKKESVNEVTLKKGDILKFKTGSKWKVVGPHGDGYRFRIDNQRGLSWQPSGWLDMMFRDKKVVVEGKVNEAEFKHISKDEHKIKLAIKDVEKKSRLKANRDKTPEYEQEALNKIMLSKVLGREKLSSKYKAAWTKLKKEYSLKESKVMKKNTPLNEVSTISKRRAGAELKQKLKGKRSDGFGKYTSTIYGMDGGKRVELKGLNDLNKYSEFEIDESVDEGLWDNIRKKKARGGKKAKPGDKDYPDSKAWKDAQESVNEGLSSSDIKKATETIKKYIKKLGSKANGTSDQVAIDIAKILGWTGSKIDQLEDYLRKINGGSEEMIFEASRGKVHKAVKKGSYPVTIVVISNGMVIKQQLVNTPEAVPAHFNTLQKQYPNANLSIEDKTGLRLFSESVNEGPLNEMVLSLPVVAALITTTGILGRLALMSDDKFTKLMGQTKGDVKGIGKIFKKGFNNYAKLLPVIGKKIKYKELQDFQRAEIAKYINDELTDADIVKILSEDPQIKKLIDSIANGAKHHKALYNHIKGLGGGKSGQYGYFYINDKFKKLRAKIAKGTVESVNETKLITEYTDQEILDMLLKSQAMAKKESQPGLVKGLHKHIKDLEKKIKQAKSESVNEDKLTEIRKGDYVNSSTEVGLVNKVSGSGGNQVAYVKFDSRPKSFIPILARNLTKTGKKHKGKDLYQEGIKEAKVSYDFSEEELKRVLQVLGRNASTEVKMIKTFEKALGRKLTRDELFESVNEAVKPVKLSGNLKKDLKTVTDIAGKMVKYAKVNFNTYIPTGHMLSQLIVGGSTEEDVLKYNIAHLAKAINTDLKKKYMKDFMGESVNEKTKVNPEVGVDAKFSKVIAKIPNSKITRDIVLKAAKKFNVDPDHAISYVEFGWDLDLDESVNEGSRKKVTKSMWQKMSDDEKENALLTVFEDPDTAQKWIERKWNSLPGSVARDMYTESVGKPKVNERFKHNDMYAMLDIAAGYSSTQHQAANQMWSDEQDLYDYLKSDHIPKKYHKDFYNDVKRRFKGVNESVNEGKEQTVAKGKWEIVKVPKGSNNSTRLGDRYYLLLGGQHVGGSVTADGSFSPASSGNSSEDYVMKILKKAKIVESVNEAQLQDLPIKSLLGLGKFATVSMGEKKLGELSDAFEDIGDEQAARIADHLDMAIKLMKDGLGKSAVKHMNKFNKACGKELSRSK